MRELMSMPSMRAVKWLGKGRLSSGRQRVGGESNLRACTLVRAGADLRHFNAHSIFLVHLLR
jgi:hypothetical protein